MSRRTLSFKSESALRWDGIAFDGLHLGGWMCKLCGCHWVEEVEHCKNCLGEPIGPFDLYSHPTNEWDASKYIGDETEALAALVEKYKLDVDFDKKEGMWYVKFNAAPDNGMKFYGIAGKTWKEALRKAQRSIAWWEEKMHGSQRKS